MLFSKVMILTNNVFAESEIIPTLGSLIKFEVLKRQNLVATKTQWPLTNTKDTFNGAVELPNWIFSGQRGNKNFSVDISPLHSCVAFGLAHLRAKTGAVFLSIVISMSQIGRRPYQWQQMKINCKLRLVMFANWLTTISVLLFFSHEGVQNWPCVSFLASLEKTETSNLVLEISYH